MSLFRRFGARAAPSKASIRALQSQQLWNIQHRHQSLAITKIGMEIAKARLRMRPGNQGERGGNWLFLAFYKWFFVGQCVVMMMPFWFMMPYFGDFVRWFNYHTLALYPDSYRDPLIPPPYTWGEAHNDFIKQLEIRKARLAKQQKNEKEIFQISEADKLATERREQEFLKEATTIYKQAIPY